MTQVESYSPRRARRASHSSSPLTPPESNPGRRSAYQPAVPVDPGTLRGRHSTTLGQGFSWVIGWTIVGALVPGAGLAAAGWRKLGGFLLFLQVLVVMGAAGLVLTGGGPRQALGVVADPTKLLVAASVVAVLALLWVVFLLLTNTSLRRYATLTRPQQVFSGVLMLALLAGIALPAYKVTDSAVLARGVLGSVLDEGSKNSAIDEKAADPWADKPRMNVLLIGSDAGADRIGIRPDTLVLASIDTKSGNTVMFSLPRNLGHTPFPVGSPGAQRWPDGYWCPNPTTGLNDCLINAVWQWGESDEGRQYYTGKDPGLKATEDAVRGVTGLPVDSYVMLNLKGFQQFIDAIGGIRMDVQERLPIGGNSSYRVAVGGWIEKGDNKKLDGYHALWYARSRWSTDDYDRMRRQRCVIAATVSQASPTDLALNFPKIAKTLKTNLSTGIAQSQIQAWVDLSLRVQKAKVYSLPFTDKVVTDRDNPDYAEIQSLVQKALKRSTAAPAPSASASAPASPGASPSAGTGTTKDNANPLKAQDVKAVC